MLAGSGTAVVLGSATLACNTIAPSSPTPAAQSPTTTVGTTPATLMRVGHDSPTTHPNHSAAIALKNAIETQTENRVAVVVYPNGQLGDEAAMVNGMKIGALEGVITSTVSLQPSVKEFGVFDLPFIFADSDQSLRAANGALGNRLKAQTNPAVDGELLAFCAAGDRDMWNYKRPISSPSDVKGLKMRISGSGIQADTYEALGALPTVISLQELYSALQNHVVDGADNGPVDIVDLKFYEVTKYFAWTRHRLPVSAIVVSKRFMQKLSESDRDAVRAAASAAATVETNAQNEQAATATATITSHGLVVNEVADRAAFVTMLEGVYAKNAASVGGQAIIDLARQG
jgi:tripartite ATP-independent transporter DctP family solute receptor